MKKRKRRTNTAILNQADMLEQILCVLMEADQKLDYLIKNLRRFNGNHNHLNHTLTEFMG